MRVRLALGVEEVLGLVMVGWGYIVMVSELSCSPAPMPLKVITVHTKLQPPSPLDESHCSHPPHIIG